MAKKKQTKTEEPTSNTGAYIFYGVCALLLIGIVVFFSIEQTEPLQEEPALPTPDGILETIERIELLDQGYYTDWHEERLTEQMINPQYIDPYLAELDTLYAEVEAANGTEANISLDFIQSRRRMLKSQKYFQMALAGGTDSVYHKGFSCEDKDQLLYYTNLYNQSVTEGQPFFRLMDRVLRKSKPSQEVIGLDDEKPRFYKSPLGNILYAIDLNLYMIDTFCEGKVDRNNPRFEEFLKHQNLTREEFEKQIGIAQ